MTYSVQSGQSPWGDEFKHQGEIEIWFTKPGRDSEHHMGLGDSRYMSE